jgi:hypothetical protein
MTSKDLQAGKLVGGNEKRAGGRVFTWFLAGQKQSYK